MEKANFFWQGDLSVVEISSIKSFIKNGFDVTIWSYEGISVDGAKTRNAHEIMGDLFIEQDNIHLGVTKITAFSDLMRYSILSKESGWWFDCDCFCLKNEIEFKNLRESIGENKILCGLHDCGELIAASGVLYLDKEIALELKEMCISILDSHNYSLPKWGMIGPELVHNYLLKNNILYRALPVNYFYELGYGEINMFLDANKIDISKQRVENSYITHAWDSILNINKVDKNNPPQGSYLDYLVQTFK